VGSKCNNEIADEEILQEQYSFLDVKQTWREKYIYPFFCLRAVMLGSPNAFKKTFAFSNHFRVKLIISQS